MKKLILILLFPLTLFSQNQERISTAYAEINTGVAFIDEIPFPGMSGLIGTTLNAGGFLIDLEAGVALPTLWTAKMGVGYEMGRSQVTAGLRPFPAHVYIQHVITGKKYGAFLISVELGLYVTLSLSNLHISVVVPSLFFLIDLFILKSRPGI